MEIGEFSWKRGLKFCVFLYAIGTPLGIVRTVFAHEMSPSTWMWSCLAAYAVAILIRVLPSWVQGGRARFLPWLTEIVLFGGFSLFAATAHRGGLFFYEGNWRRSLLWFLGVTLFCFFSGGLSAPGSAKKRDAWEKWMKHWRG